MSTSAASGAAAGLVSCPHFLPSFPSRHHWGIAGVPSPGEGLEGTSGQPLAAPQGCRSSSCTSAAQHSLQTPCPTFPPDTGDFHRSGFGTIFSFFSLRWFLLILVPLFLHGAGHLSKFLPSPCPSWLTCTAGTNGRLVSPEGTSIPRFGAIHGLQP